MLEVHQALHGYADGHHLLQSSIRLPSDAERTLLVLSDISGPTVRASIKTYLTGYPLNEDMYAFARTWLATEMPRPGSVWTHTLLIPRETFSERMDPLALMSLFRRPEHPTENLELYTSTLSLPRYEISSLDLNLTAMTVATEIVAALYGQPSRPVIVLAKALEQYESLTLALWRQQWPALQRRFSFCTAALTPRRLVRTPFDFQVMPITVHAQYKGINAIVIDAKTHHPRPGEHGDWVGYATSALFEPTHSSFNNFIAEFGNDTGGSRSAFGALAETYSAVASAVAGEEIRELVELVGQRFPQPHDAARLKFMLFGGAPAQEYWSTTQKDREARILDALVQSQSARAFDPQQLRVRERARLVAGADSARVREVLDDLSDDRLLGELVRAFMAGVVDSIAPKDIGKFVDLRKEALLALCRENPKLITTASTWRLPQAIKIKLWEAVRSETWTADAIRGIIDSMLEAADEQLAEDAVSTFADTAVVCALDWVDTGVRRQERRSVPSVWQRALGRRRAAILKWLKEHAAPESQTVALIGQMVSQKFGAVFNESELSIIRNIGEAAEASYSIESRTELLALLLSLALQGVGHPPEDFAVLSFQIVHDATANEQISSDAWSLLEPHVPFLWSRNWDKCERLRQALGDSFVRYGWSPRGFVRIVNDDNTFRKVVTFMAETRDGRAFLRRVRDDAPPEFSGTRILNEMGPRYNTFSGWW